MDGEEPYNYLHVHTNDINIRQAELAQI